jgi:multidrug transporter EmrE-like cation transporter
MYNAEKSIFSKQNVYIKYMSVPQLFALTCVEIVGDFGLKEYANNGGIKALAMGIIGYIGVVIMLIVSLQDSSILLVNNGWDGMSSLTESIAAYVFLGERFDNYNQYIGIFLIMIGMYLLKIPWKKNHPFHIPKL